MLLADEIERRSNAEGLYVPIEQVQNSRDKIERVQNLQLLVRSGTLQFSGRHTALLKQMRLFPKAALDDGPDALEMAVAAAREVYRPITADDVIWGPSFEERTTDQDVYGNFFGRRSPW